MADDKVSVIIPVFNSEEFLHDSINSVLNQTHKNLEIIAINDGSTDKSLEILQQFSDKIIVISQLNQGLASAIKTGIKKMHGKWFKWFSPDDILYPNAIEILVKEANKLPENTIVYSNWEIIDENSEKMRDFSESNFNDLEKFDFNVRLLDGQQINVNTTLIPTSLFTRGCLFQNLKDQSIVHNKLIQVQFDKKITFELDSYSWLIRMTAFLFNLYLEIFNFYLFNFRFNNYSKKFVFPISPFIFYRKYK